MFLGEKERKQFWPKIENKCVGTKQMKFIFTIGIHQRKSSINAIDGFLEKDKKIKQFWPKVENKCVGTENHGNCFLQ